MGNRKKWPRRNRGRHILSAGLILLAAATAGTPAAFAQKKEIIQLQRDMELLSQTVRDVQRSIDEKHAVLKTLIEQSLDSVNRLNTTMGALQKAVQDVQASTGARVDSMAIQVQALADNLEEVKVRLGRLTQQLSDAQGVIQNLDAKIAGGAPLPVEGGSPAAPGSVASAEVLYSNALRDYTTGKFDLARQEFLDYLKSYPDTDLASNAEFYLGEILFTEKKYRESIAQYDRVLENHPKSFKLADARLKKGMALLELGQKTSAIRELREVARRHPGTEADRRARAKLRELGATISGG